jgi:hypothetical protein
MSNDKTLKIYEEKYKNRADELASAGNFTKQSLFQLKYFVIGKEHTHQSKLWRCLTEIESRKDQLENINLELEDIKDQIELLKLEEIPYRNEAEQKIRTRIKERKILKITKNADKIAQKQEEIVRELIFFVEAYESLEKIEPLKPYDDIDVQTEYWNEKISQELNLRMLIGRGLDIEVVKTALSLNDKAPVKKEIANLLENSIKNKQLELKNGR